MATTEMTFQPADISHKALTMALSILVDHVRRLPRDDKNDLFELLKELPNASTDEDIESIFSALHEILEQAPVGVREMDLAAEPSVGRGLQTWLDAISAKIKSGRIQAGLTQEQLAEKSGLPLSYIGRLENGQHSPSRLTLEKLAAALGVDVSVFDSAA